MCLGENQNLAPLQIKIIANRQMLAEERVYF